MKPPSSEDNRSAVKKIYFAGELFSLKHLMGNALLAQQIEKESNGRYSVVLPQNLESAAKRGKQIRDADLVSLLGCDLGVFNFDGQELDSGTVAEFLFAKFADIPAVVIRTDFRASGDNADVPWNLMIHYYPRTTIILLHSMKEYANAVLSGKSATEGAQEINRQMGRRIYQSLNQVERMPAIASRADKGFLRNWIGRCAGLEPADIEVVSQALTKRL